MTRNALVVFCEGHTEKRFVEALCGPGTVVRIIGNGKGVRIEHIVAQVASQLRLMKSVQNAIVILDREKRQEAANVLADDIRAQLEQAHCGVRFAVGIADREFESWIIADKASLARDLGCDVDTLDKINAEGEFGSAILAECFHRHDRPFHKPVDGPRLLKAAEPRAIAQRSPSASAILEQLTDVDCWWLKK